jgi:hypothetical protein
MMAYFILHRGPTPAFLSENMFQALVVGLESFIPTLSDVADCDYKNQIELVRKLTQFYLLLRRMYKFRGNACN